MSDEFIDRLRADDPASKETPDLSAIKAKVDAHTADNVIAFSSKRSQYARGLRIAAAVSALALAGGVGFVGGSWRNSPGTGIGAQVLKTQDGASVATSGEAAAPNVGRGGGFAAADSKVAGNYVGGYFGSAILQPGDNLPNAVGTAAAFRFSADGVDSQALARSLAKAMGIDAAKLASQPDGSWQASDDRGAYNVFVQADGMKWFSAYVQARSPWFCDVVDGSTGKEPSAAETQAQQAKCDEQWPTPSKADAIAAAKQSIAALGLQLADGAKYSTYSYSPRLMTVVMTPMVDGMAVGSTWQVEVAKNGVFSINGYAARPVKAAAYPTVGARDAALRSALRKWQAFGPQQLFDPEAAASTVGVQPTPVVKTKDGKPMLQGYFSEVAVQGAVRGLMQVNLADGTSMLMPAWDFTAGDGTRWQMLAITEDYIDWQAQPAGGPVAYDAVGAVVRASGGVAAPATK